MQPATERATSLESIPGSNPGGQPLGCPYRGSLAIRGRRLAASPLAPTHPVRGQIAQAGESIRSVRSPEATLVSRVGSSPTLPVCSPWQRLRRAQPRHWCCLEAPSVNLGGHQTVAGGLGCPSTHLMRDGIARQFRRVHDPEAAGSSPAPAISPARTTVTSHFERVTAGSNPVGRSNPSSVGKPGLRRYSPVVHSSGLTSGLVRRPWRTQSMALHGVQVPEGPLGVVTVAPGEVRQLRTVGLSTLNGSAWYAETTAVSIRQEGELLRPVTAVSPGSNPGCGSTVTRQGDRHSSSAR